MSGDQTPRREKRAPDQSGQQPRAGPYGRSSVHVEDVGFVLVMFGVGGIAWTLRDVARPMAYVDLAAVVVGAGFLLAARLRARRE